MARRLDLTYEEVIDKIMEKKEFSKLPREDVKKAYEEFRDSDYVLEDQIKETRDLLRKMYTAFVSDKLLTIKDKDAEWFLRKHISTAERMENYEAVYFRILDGIVPDMKSYCPHATGKTELINVYDLGCGINGFSYSEFEKAGFNVKYHGLEAVKQLVDLQNNYFEKNKVENAKCEAISLFDLDATEKFIANGEGKKVVFLFKTLDSLEMLQKNYSFDLLEKIVPMVDRVIVSWATRSLVSKKKFYANRKWLKDFVSENYEIIDEFDEGVEHYLVFQKK